MTIKYEPSWHKWQSNAKIHINYPQPSLNLYLSILEQQDREEEDKEEQKALGASWGKYISFIFLFSIFVNLPWYVLKWITSLGLWLDLIMNYIDY